jgi:hypothetical protein
MKRRNALKEGFNDQSGRSLKAGHGGCPAAELTEEGLVFRSF